MPLKIQAAIPSQLDEWSDNMPVRFIDAYDRKISISYEWRMTWKVCVHPPAALRQRKGYISYILRPQSFHRQLCAATQARGSLDTLWVWIRFGLYQIFDERDNAMPTTIKREDWEQTIRPGIIISLVLNSIQDVYEAAIQECWTCRKPRVGSIDTKVVQRVRW